MVKYDIKEDDLRVVYDSTVKAHATLDLMGLLPARFEVVKNQLMSVIEKLAEDLDAIERRKAMDAIRTKKVNPSEVIRMGTAQEGEN